MSTQAVRWTLAPPAMGHAFPRADPRPMLAAAYDAWDLFRVSPGRSHRGGLAGALVWLGKHAALASLRPLYSELLRPQRAFNWALVLALRAAVTTNSATDRAAAAARHLPRLRALADPLAFAIRSHRGPLVGPAVDALKTGAVGAVATGLTPFYERFAASNRLATELVEQFFGDAPLDERALHRALGELRELGHPPRPERLGPLSRAARPVWSELLRRQERFAYEAATTLAALFGLPLSAAEAPPGYPDCLAAAEASRAATVNAAIAADPRGPLISIVTPTYRTPIELLDACVGSVLAQTYRNWELVLVDDGSHTPALNERLQHYATSDARIRVRVLPTNRGIAGATNEALAMATGDYVGFLDHDDELAPTALAEVVLRLRERPATDVLYCDEDQLDREGRRTRPFFKPAWSPELLRSVNYVCHFLVVRRALATELGGVRPGFEGAQDYDFILRLAERTNRFEHLAHLLYRWRMAPTSTAANINNKPAAKRSGVRALEEHLKRTHSPGKVQSPIPTHYAITPTTPRKTTVSIVVLAAQQPDLQRMLGRSLKGAQVIVASTEGAPHDDGRAGAQWTTGPAALPAAIRAAHGDVIVVLHDDTRLFHARDLAMLVGVAARPEVGLVTPKVLNPDGTIQHVGLTLTERGGLGLFSGLADTNGWTGLGHANWAREVGAVSSCAFALRRALWSDADWDGSAGYAEAVARLSERMRERGLRVVSAPLATVEHTPHDGCPDLTRPLPRPQADPFYNPWLSRERAIGALASDAEKTST